MISKKLVNFYLTFHASRRIREIREIYTRPLRLQERALFSILDKARYTEFGRTYDFKSITSISEYQNRVPLLKYEKMRPWIDRVRDGESNVIWPGRIWNFALTSGTTSGNKYIPISKELIATNKKAALDCLVFYFAENNGRSHLGEKFLFLGGSTALNRLEKGGLAGDLSGVVSRSSSLFARSMCEPDEETAFIADWEEKIKRIAEKTADRDIWGIAGIPSWLLVFFNRLLEEAARRKNKKVETVADVWPGFSLLIHAGINFSPYSELFKKIIGKDVYYLEAYPASEAFIAIQDKKDERGLLLMMDYEIFYEFVPVGEVDTKNPTRLTAADVEKDKNYAIIITNNSGLYSYVLGDTVKFVSLKPPRLVVTGRINYYLSAFGEHLIAEDVEDAVSYACGETGSEIEDFTVAPFFQSSRKGLPYHEWLIEFIKEPSNLEEFAGYLDERLRGRNEDYDVHRMGDISIGRPKVVPLRKGTFYYWMKSDGKLGGQHKVPPLKNDRSLADILLSGRFFDGTDSPSAG